jgi:uncharacterized membrane protein
MTKLNPRTIELLSGIADMSSTFASLYIALKVYQTTSSVLKAFAAFVGTGCLLLILLAIVIKVTVSPKDLEEVLGPPQ